MAYKSDFVNTNSPNNRLSEDIIATDEKYTGKMVLGKTTRTKVGDPCSAKRCSTNDWIVVPNTHPALVSQEKFDRVAEKIHTKRNHHGNTVNHKSGIFCCGYCGHSLQRSGKKNITLKCRYSLMSRETECLSEGISLEELYEILNEILKKQFCVMQHEAQLYKTAVQSNKSVSADLLEYEMIQLKKNRFNAYEKFKNDDMSREELDEIRGTISKRINEIEEILKTVNNQVEVSEIKTHKADTILNYNCDEKFDKDFIDYFVKRVNIYKDKRIEIVWNFGLDEFLNMRVDTP